MTSKNDAVYRILPNGDKIQMRINTTHDLRSKGGNPNHDKLGKFASKSGVKEVPSHVDLKSPDGKKLLTITKKWQGASGQVEAIQRDFMTRASGKKTASHQRDEHMRVLKDGIKNSNTNTSVQYRGVRLHKDSDPLVAFGKGKQFIVPPSSFSSEERIARQFVDKKQEASHTILLRAAPGKMRGLKVDTWGDPAYAYEKETISAGQFTVKNIEKLPGNKGYVVDIEHTAMFDWED